VNGDGRPLLPAVQVLGSAVLLQGPAVLDQLAATGALIRELKASGMQVPARVLDEQRALAVAASVIRGQQVPVSVPRQRDATSGPSPSESTSTVHIGTREAAEMLGVSQRHAQRIASSIGGEQLPNRRFTFDRLAVEAYLLDSRDRRPTAA
jgi:hypothetical protein